MLEANELPRRGNYRDGYDVVCTYCGHTFEEHESVDAKSMTEKKISLSTFTLS